MKTNKEMECVMLKHRLNIAEKLLCELRQVYLVDLGTDGEPETSLSDMFKLWDNVNKFLKIKTNNKK